MAASLVLAVIGTGAAGASMSDAQEVPASATFSLGDAARVHADEPSGNSLEEARRAAAEHNAAVALAAARAAQKEAAAKARAAALAAERKAAAQKASREAQRTRLVTSARSDPKGAARAMLGDFGFSGGQWSCLEQLWTGESNWSYRASNASSGAGGIPQALPASKMASAGADWQTNPATQIKWGLQYIKNTYGSPCAALNQWNSRSPHWY